MKKLITGGLLALLMAGGGAALAEKPSESNLIEGGHPALYGLCNAWSHNANGREHGKAEEAPPFRELQESADLNGDGDGTATEDEVAALCDGIEPGNPAAE